MMKTLVNWSVYSMDIDRFANGWQGVERYVADYRLDGIELLIGYDRPSADIPSGLVHGIHLPLWVSWLDIWRNAPDAVERYFPQADPRLVTYYGGGHNPADMALNLGRLWRAAAKSGAEYMVWHVSHCETAHAFTRAYTYSDEDVVDALAELFNATAASFPNQEPPLTLALENVWWPGLTFTRNEIAVRLAEKLVFDNWCFVLDPAHLMNTNRNLRYEEEAIDFVLETIAQLNPAVIDRIQVVHLNLSLSGPLQQETIQRGLPTDFTTLSYPNQLGLAKPIIHLIDQHQPFTSSRCAEIVKAVGPRTLVHEFTSKDLAELSQKLSTQLRAYPVSCS
ncbi:MAG: sugar phosphate isomerase [Chloroflexota bacterium]